MKAKENLILLSVSVFFAVVFLGLLMTPTQSSDSTGYAIGDVSCLDTDGGLNSGMAGFVSYTAVGITTNFPDTCRDTHKLLEYHCVDNSLKSEIISCDFGCSNNACRN